VDRFILQVYLLTRGGSKARNTKFPSNVSVVDEPTRFLSNGEIELSSGGRVQADGVILCTGYNFSFPFLEKECGVEVKNQRVKPLYKHCVHIHHPSLFFIGLPITIVPFPAFHMQMEFCANVLSPRNNFVLPSESEMFADAERELQKRLAIGWPERHYHKMAGLQFEYFDDLADLCGVPRLGPVYKALYERVGKWRAYDVVESKLRRFKVVDEKTFLDVTGDGRENEFEKIDTKAIAAF
jgi:hypothetical protein